jgi:hypothetical protein
MAKVATVLQSRLKLVNAIKYLIGHVPDSIVGRELLVLHELWQTVVDIGEASCLGEDPLPSRPMHHKQEAPTQGTLGWGLKCVLLWRNSAA